MGIGRNPKLWDEFKIGLESEIGIDRNPKPEFPKPSFQSFRFLVSGSTPSFGFVVSDSFPTRPPSGAICVGLVDQLMTTDNLNSRSQQIISIVDLSR